MKIKLLTDRQNVDGIIKTGTVIDVSDDEGNALIKVKKAKEVKENE